MATSTIPAFQLDGAGLLVLVTVADPCQIEPGVWHVPRGAVTVPPPADWPPQVRALFASNEQLQADAALQQLQSQALAELTTWPRYNGACWELVTRPRPQQQAELTALERLQAFLAANPDVAELITRGSA
jgi:hypothetical protein